jgi:signal peptidase II
MNLARIFFVASIVFLVDQFTKIYVIRVLELDEKLFISVFDPFLNFQMAWNRGINFGLFGSNAESTKVILILVAVTICVVLVWWVRKSNRVLSHIFVGFVVGAVVDFLNMSCCGVTNPFSFNFADIAIFLGAVGLLFFGEEEEKESK